MAAVKEWEQVKESVKSQTNKKNLNKIILHNDDYNSFQHVIVCLRLYVGYKYDDALESAKRVHNEGYDIIIEGTESELTPIYKNLQNQGLTVSFH